MYEKGSPDRLSVGRISAIVWTLIAVTFVAAPVFAQAEDEEPDYADSSEREQRLNDEAVSAIITKDYTRAIALLEESLALGESNIIYLNLGRAYQKIGDCEKAREALQKVETAPIVRDPPADFVNEKARQYLEELDELCADQETPESDGDGKGASVEDPGSSDGSDGTETSDTDGTSTSDMDPPPTDSSGGWKTGVGWGAVGTGVALIGGGVAMHFVAESERNGIGGENGNTASVTYAEARDIETKANTFDTVGLSMGIAGGVIAGIGAYLLATSGSPEADSSRVSIQPYRGGASVLWRMRW